MPDEVPSQPSFTPHRQWLMTLQVALLVGAVFSVVVMLNYLSRDYFGRWHLSDRTKTPLSPQTVRFVEGLTNRVKITLYYDQGNRFFGMIDSLASEYHLLNRRITIQMADYIRDPATAQAVKATYKDKFGAETDKDLIIFDCDGRVKAFPGDELAQYALSQSSDPDRHIDRKLVGFLGERMFTAALIAVTSPKLPVIYFLTRHDEHPIDSGDELKGYLNLALALRSTPAVVTNLSLIDTKTVPADCSLLVVAGPTKALLDFELQSLEQYLERGGRMLVLFSYESVGKTTGLEKLLAQWGVDVGQNVVVDPEHSSQGSDVIVGAFADHPLVKNLLASRSGLFMLRPRTIGVLRPSGGSADAPHVEPVAATGTNAFLIVNGQATSTRRSFPLMVAVEKGAVKDVNTERGTTRLVVAGDSLFLANGLIDQLNDRDFASYAANWLLERPQLLGGPGPRPVAEYRLLMTRNQLRNAAWILLGGMPGAILLVGMVVWIRRRK